MEEYIRDMWGGPGHLRFYLQPLLAFVLGLRDGVGDARAGRPPYIISVLTAPAEWRTRLVELLKRLSKPLALAISMDLIFQIIIRGRWRPLASLVYATFFVAFPYAALRGLINRIASHLPGATERHRPRA